MERIILLFGFFYFFCIHATKSQDSDLLNEAKHLQENGQEFDAFKKYQDIISSNPLNFEALCGASFLASKVGNREIDKEAQTKYFKMAKAYAQRALDINQNHFESNYVMAIALGRNAIIAGPKGKVEASKEIKMFADKALSLNSSNAGVWNVIGVWHVTMANLNFAEMAAAKALFGGLPKGASNEKAVECFKKAIQLDSNSRFYYFGLAQTYAALGQNENALKSIDIGLALGATNNPDDPKTKSDLVNLKNRILK